MKFSLAILQTAALLVPTSQREEWLAEWRSELWYVSTNTATFCAGAFRDALWVRRNNAKPRLQLVSPVHCILVLTALAAASVFFALRLQLPRSVLLPSPYRNARNLVMLSANGRYDVQVPTVRFEQFQSLTRRIPFRFTGLAFYRPVRSGSMTVALASDNLFDLLQVPAGAKLVLTRSAWRKYYHSDPHTAAAVIPDNLWTLPGRIDAWRLVDASQLAGAKGFVLARLGPAAPTAQRWDFEGFACTSLMRENLLSAYFAVTLLSVFLLWATTSFSLGEYPANRTCRVRRWMFFSLKIALLLPIVACGSLDLASILSAGFQPHAFILGTVIGFRWALADQRRRCPVCLRVLSNPTRIGGPSHVFLEWYGTELICAHGHGLLYVPEIPTSCYSTQRWQNLDASWSTLFS